MSATRGTGAGCLLEPTGAGRNAVEDRAASQRDSWLSEAIAGRAFGRGAARARGSDPAAAADRGTVRMGSEASAGRATAQPNVPGRGIVAGFGWRFWLIVIGLGVVTGIGSGLLLKLLDALETRAVGKLAPDADRRDRTSFVDAPRAGPSGRRADRRRRRAVPATDQGRHRSLRGALARGREDAAAADIARAVDSIIAVGFGASLGLEAGPQQVGASFASAVSDWAKLPVWQRGLLVACGARVGASRRSTTCRSAARCSRSR